MPPYPVKPEGGIDWDRVNGVPQPTAKPDGDEHLNPDYDIQPYSGPYEFLTQHLPLKNAQLYQELEHELTPIQKIGARLSPAVGLLDPDDEAVLIGKGVPAWAARHGKDIDAEVAKFRAGEAEARQEFTYFKDRFGAKGLAYSGSRLDLVRGALRRLRAELGPEWNQRASRADQGTLLSSAMLIEAVVGSKLTSSDPREIDGLVRDRLVSALPAKVDIAPGQVSMDMAEIKQWLDRTASPLAEYCDDPMARVYDTPPRKPPEVVQKWYGYRTNGVTTDGIALPNLRDNMTELVRAHETLGNRLRNSQKWEKLGVVIPSEAVGPDGDILLSQLPLNAAPLQRYANLRALNVGEGDRHGLALFNARKRIQELLMETPAAVPSLLLPEANGNKYLTDTISSLVEDLVKIKDPAERHLAFERFSRHYLDRTFAAVVPGIPVGMRPAPSPEEEAALRSLPERLSHYEGELQLRDLERQDKAQQLMPEYDPRVAEDLRQRSNLFNEAQIRQKREIEDALRQAPLTSFVVAVPTLIGKVLAKTGLSDVSHIFLAPAMDEIREAVMETTRPGMEMVAAQREGMGDWLMKDIFGYDTDINESIARYAERIKAGKAWWLDDLGLATQVVWDGLMKSGKFAEEDPLGFAALGVSMGLYGRGVGKVGAKLVNWGMPVRAAGLVELLCNPLGLQGMRKIIGWSPSGTRRLGLPEFWMVRQLNKMGASPELAEAFYAFMKRYFSDLREDRAGVPSDEAARIDTAEATAAAIVNKAQHGKVRLNDLWDLELPGLTDIQVRQLFQPFNRANLSMGAGAIEAAAQFVKSLDDLRDMEATLRNNYKTPLSELPQPLESLFVDAVNAYNKASYGTWRAALNSKLAQKILPTEFRQSLLEYFDRGVKIEDVAPHAMHEFRTATAALEQHRGPAVEVKNAMGLGAERAGARINTLESDVRVLNLQKELLEMERQRLGEAFDLPERLKGVERQAAAKAQELEAVRHYERQFLYNRKRIDDLAAVSVLGEQGAQGLEIGLKNNLSAGAKDFLANTLFDLALAHGPKFFEEFQLPVDFVRAVNRARDKVGISIKKLETNFQRMEYLAKTEVPSVAGRALKLPKSERTFENVMNKIDQMRQMVESARKSVRRKVRQALEYTDEFFDVPSLEQSYQLALEAGRRHAENMRRFAAIDPGPAGTYLELINLVKNPRYQNRAMGLTETHMAASNNLNNIMTNVIRRNWDKLSLQDKEFADRLFEDPSQMGTPEVWEKAANIVWSETGMRNVLITMLEQRGQITPELAAEWRNPKYDAHYYLNYEYAAQLRNLGVPIGKDSPVTVNIGLSRTPKYEHLEVQQSPRYARVLVKGEKPTYFNLEDYAGDPHKATAAANRYVKERLEAQDLLEGDYQVVPAIPMERMVELGYMKSNGLFRFETLRRLFADTMRTDVFAHIATMSGTKRRTLDGIPIRRRREWLPEPLKGKEWGPLEGFYLHKSVLRMMNTWDEWHGVMNAITEEVKAQIAAVWTPTGFIDKVLYGDTHQGWAARALRWSDRQLRHALIVRNTGSWVNNHIGALMSAFVAGINPLDPRFWRFRSVFYKELDAVTTKGVVSSAFADIATSGGLSPTGGMPGKFHLEAAAGTPFHKILRKAHELNNADQLRLAKEVEEISGTMERAVTYITTGKIKGDAATRTLDNLHRWAALLKDKQRQMIRGHLQNPTWTAAKTDLVELKNILVKADKSQVSQLLAEQYGLIDPSYRYATYRYLTEIKGFSKEAALDQLANLFQNYSAVPPWIRQLQKMPVFGAFVPGFPYEAGRLLANSFFYDPARFVAVTSVPFVINMANMMVNGVLPSEMLLNTNAKTWWDQMREMLFTIRIDAGDLSMRLDLSSASMLGPFLRPTGGLRPKLASLEKGLEDTLPLGMAFPLTALLNFGSNFIFNTPYGEAMEKHAFGVDPYKQEVTYGRFGDVSPITGFMGAMKDAAGLFVPRTLLRTMEEVQKTGVTSLITKHNQGQLQALTRGLTGLNLSSMTRSEVFARVILKYAGVERAGQVLRESMDDQEEYRKLILQAGQAPSLEEEKRLLKEAAALNRASKAGKVLIGGQEYDVGITEPDAMRRAIDAVSRNIYAEIQKIPIDKVPLALHELETSNMAETNRPELDHMWRQISDSQYLSGRSDLDDLAEAAQTCTRLSESSLRPDLKFKYTAAYVMIVKRMADVIRTSYGPNQLRALHTKTGQYPAALRRLLYLRLGL